MPDIAERRAAAVRLAEALRALSAAAVLSEVPADELDAVAEQARGLAARLTATARPADGLASIDDLAAGIRMFNPANGEASPFAPPVRYDTSAAEVTGRVILGPGFEGHTGYVHGGTTALLFDDALGAAASRQIWPTVTSQLAVRYLRPVPIGLPLLIRASVTATRGRRITIQGDPGHRGQPGHGSGQRRGRVHRPAAGTGRSAARLGLPPLTRWPAPPGRAGARAAWLRPRASGEPAASPGRLGGPAERYETPHRCRPGVLKARSHAVGCLAGFGGGLASG